MPGKGLFPFHIATGPVYWCMWAAPYQATLWEYATVFVIMVRFATLLYLLLLDH